MYRVIPLRPLYRILAAGAALAILLTMVWVMPGKAVATARVQDAIAVPIIMYHSLLEDVSRQGRFVISPALLEQDLRYLREQGYTTVVIADLLAYVEEGVPLPDKPIVLTFDDGYYNNFAYAFPLLKQYGMRGVISPIAYWAEHYTANPNESNRVQYSHATWAQLREMAESGVFEIQNHSYAMHRNDAGGRKGIAKRADETTEAYQALLRQDLTAAQEGLTQHVGVTPTAFTYPFGALCRDAIPVLEELGFRATLICESRMNYLTQDPSCLWGLGRYLRPAGTGSAAYFQPIFRASEAPG